MGPHAEASVGCGGGDDIVDPWQDAQRRSSAGVMDKDNGQILDYLEHVRHH
jgi:hypothetical protein